MLGPAEYELASDRQGQVSFEVPMTGRYSIRARYLEERAGVDDAAAEKSQRHYSMLALLVPSTSSVFRSQQGNRKVTYPDLPESVTSLGAAIVDDYLYVYGGHTGHAHSYAHDEQAHNLCRLDLQNPQSWESLAEGPALQGLAMVAYDGKLYRIGGFTARNEAGEDNDLWSQSLVACYDPASGAWRDLPQLPEPRSSFDAAVLGAKIYVSGGWNLHGGDNATWLTTAYALDLSSATPTWERLPDPPFQRRALSVAAYDGKIFVVGGMQQQGGPTTRVDVFDPDTQQWSRGPNLPGEEEMEGFGNSAFAIDGHLYVSTISGNLLRLASDGSTWEIDRKLERARFFHRMLPFGKRHLVLVGGANMSVGKFAQVDVIDVGTDR